MSHIHRKTVVEVAAITAIVAALGSTVLPGMLAMGGQSRATTLAQVHKQLEIALDQPQIGDIAAERFPATRVAVMALLGPTDSMVFSREAQDLLRISHRGTAPQSRGNCSLLYDARTATVLGPINPADC